MGKGTVYLFTRNGLGNAPEDLQRILAVNFLGLVADSGLTSPGIFTRGKRESPAVRLMIQPTCAIGEKTGGEVTMHTFDRFAEHYDNWFKTGLGRYVLHCEKELVLALAAPKPGDKVLDIGIGTGIFAVELMKYQTDITGIDVSEKMLDMARSKGLTNVAVGDAVSLDFPDESFDLVISITALEFIKEYEKAISEMVRVCKRGGRVVVATLGSGSLWALKRSRAARKDAGSVFRDARFYSFRELKRVAETFGYKTVVKGAVFALPFDNAFCIFTGRLIEKICQSLFPSRGAFLAFRIEKS